MATEYGVRNADGSVSIWATDDQGNAWPTGRKESWEQNQGLTPSAGGSAVGGGSGFPSMVGGTSQLPAYLQGIDKDLARDIYNNIQLPTFQWGQQQDLWNRALQASNLSGYMPSGNMWGGMQQGASGGAPAGGYNTKNGAKTVEQMRAELAAQDASWNTRSEADVLSEYGKLSGGQVTPGGSGGGQGAGGGDPLASSNQASQQWYRDFQARTGRAPTKEEWAQQVSMSTGMSHDNAVKAYDYWRDWQRITGKSNPSDEEWAAGLRQVQPGLGQTRTLPGEMFDESKRQWKDTFDRSGTQWDKTFGEDRRRFDTTSSGWMDGQQGRGATLDRERMYGDLLSRLSGPQDWVKYQIAQSGMPEGSLGSLQEVMARTPSFGAVRPTESYEQKMAQLYANLKQGGQQGGGGYNTLPMPGAVPLDERLLEQNFQAQQTPGRPNTGPLPPQATEGRGAPINEPAWHPNTGNEPVLSPNTGPRPPQTIGGRSYTTQVQPNMWQGMQQGAAQRQDPSGRYKPPAITDTDRAYNDAYSQAQRANGGPSDDMFRSAPPGWQPGQPTLQGRYNQGQQEVAQRQQGVGAPGRQFIGPPVRGNTTERWMGNVTQPTQISAQMFNKMTPSQKQMQTGLWQSQGIDANDAWEKMKRAFPSGQASTRTVWR